jgi:hypothetical protein
MSRLEAGGITRVVTARIDRLMNTELAVGSYPDPTVHSDVSPWTQAKVTVPPALEHTATASQLIHITKTYIRNYAYC